MTYQEILAEAIQLASGAHRGQLDKAGEPYILHPIRVMMSFQPWQHIYRIVAIMHDTLEDTDITRKMLDDRQWPADIVEAIELLTHPKGQPYNEYVSALCRPGRAYHLAQEVKRADILDNMSMERLIRLDQHEIDRLTHKYSSALKILEDYERSN